MIFLAAIALLFAPRAAPAWTEDWSGYAEGSFINEPLHSPWAINGPLQVKACPALGGKALYWYTDRVGAAAIHVGQLHYGDQSLSAMVSSGGDPIFDGAELYLCADQPGVMGLGRPYNGYGFLLRGLDGALIYKYSAGREDLLGKSANAAPADWKKFVLSCDKKGDTLSLGIDGKTAVSARDSAFQGGHAGLGVRYSGDSAVFIGRVTQSSQFSADARPQIFAPSPANPVLEGEGWERGALGEPCVISDGAGLRMSYTGGWQKAGVGIAVSDDGIHWKKLGKVLGQGQGGEPGHAQRSTLLKVDGEYRIYYSDRPGTIRLATSRDGLHFSRRAGIVIKRGAALNVTTWASQGFYRQGSVWWALVDGQYASGVSWKMHLFRSTDGGLTFKYVDGPLESMRVGYGMYGSPSEIFKIGGIYHVWYHVSENAILLPTVLWHARSPDLLHWTPDPWPTLGIPGSTMGLEIPDQVADPCLLEHEGKTFLYYSACDNTRGKMKTGLALRDGGLAELLKSYPPVPELER